MSSADAYRGVERDPAVCVIGPGCARVHHLSLTAGKRFSQCRVPALLLQARVQSQCLDKHTQTHAHKCICRLTCRDTREKTQKGH